MMLKKMITVFCAVALAFAVAGYPLADSATAGTVMKIGHAMPTDSFRHKSLLQFKEEVEKGTEGRVEVRLYPSGQLGSDTEILEAVKAGSVEGVRSGGLKEAAPLLEIYSMPFLFPDMESVHKITRGPLGEEIAKSVKPAGLIILATGDSGPFRQFTSNTRPITGPADMQGLTMRALPVPIAVRTMETLGADVVSIPFVETYMGLKTGAADGQENSLPVIVAMKFHEVQKYLTLANYQYHPEMLYVNRAWYESLDDRDQAVLKKAARDMMVYSDGLVAADDVECREFLRTKMEVNTLTPEQREAFVRAVQPVYDFYINSGTLPRAMLDKVREAAARQTH